MLRAKIVNCKKASIIKFPCKYGFVDSQLVKMVSEGDTVEINTKEYFYDLRNRIYYRVYEFGEPIGWVVRDAVEVNPKWKTAS